MTFMQETAGPMKRPTRRRASFQQERERGTPSQWAIHDGGLRTLRPWPSVWLAPEILCERSWFNGEVYAWPLRLAASPWIEREAFLEAFQRAWAASAESRLVDGPATLARTLAACRRPHV